ncbi:MAG TPA: amidohydrolase family protein [Gemmatales bacterium]|nr:amidohydrolase family protein [Gemmatales bacterium]
MPTTYRADWVFTGVGEPIRNGVLIEQAGKIVECVPWQDHQIDVELGQSLIIPGLVNAHTHLDLGALRGKLPPPAHFTDWLVQVIAYRRKANVEEWTATIDEGIRESLRHGITWLGDISFNGQSLDALSVSGMEGLVFRELIGMSHERVELALSLADDWVNDDMDDEWRGLSPHAPYTVSEPLLTMLHGHFHSTPMAMHVAETREELQLLSEKAGLFRDFLQNLGVWYPDQLFDNIDSVLKMLNDLDHAYLIHGNYLVREQWQQLSSTTTLVYCPRTHAYFGHDPHPYLQMLADGLNVALGTDSLASNPDLSILNECRFLWQRDRGQLDGAALMKLATHGGKTALLPKKWASFVVIPHDGESTDPRELLWTGTGQPSAMYIRAKLI